MFKKVLVVVVLSGIFGCQSVEEATKWEASTLSEHRKIFVECKGKSFAFKEWLEKKKKLLTKEEISDKAIQARAKCLEEKLGVILLDRVPTTRLDIHSKTSLRFYTGGDHTLLKFFERSRKWHQIIRENGEPWKGYWLEHNEVIDKWRSIYKDAN